MRYVYDKEEIMSGQRTLLQTYRNFLPAVDVLIKIEIKLTQNKTLETKDVQTVNSLLILVSILRKLLQCCGI